MGVGVGVTDTVAVGVDVGVEETFGVPPEGAGVPEAVCRTPIVPSLQP